MRLIWDMVLNDEWRRINQSHADTVHSVAVLHGKCFPSLSALIVCNPDQLGR